MQRSGTSKVINLDTFTFTLRLLRCRAKSLSSGIILTRRSKIVSRAVGRCVVMSSADHLWCAEVLQINP